MRALRERGGSSDAVTRVALRPPRASRPPGSLRSRGYQRPEDERRRIGLFPLDRHSDTRLLYVDGAQVVAAREVQGLPTIAAEGDVGGGGGARGQSAPLLARPAPAP